MNSSILSSGSENSSLDQSYIALPWYKFNPSCPLNQKNKVRKYCNGFALKIQQLIIKYNKVQTKRTLLAGSIFYICQPQTGLNIYIFLFIYSQCEPISPTKNKLASRLEPSASTPTVNKHPHLSCICFLHFKNYSQKRSYDNLSAGETRTLLVKQHKMIKL